jgi:hypothetical protein
MMPADAGPMVIFGHDWNVETCLLSPAWRGG